MNTAAARAYQTLEVPETASLQDVKRAYRLLANVWHPDRFTHDAILHSAAQVKMMEVNLAYELLNELLSVTRHAPKSNPIEAGSATPIESNPIEVGSRAPGFSLKSKQSSGLVNVTLSDNFGRTNTVLLFLVAPFTSVCTTEMREISSDLRAYAKLNAVVLGISVDSPFVQEAWAQKERIKVTLASDLNKEVSRDYNAVYHMLAGIGDTAARAAFVIDKIGVIRYAERTPMPKELPNFQAVKETLFRLKQQQESH
jgi:glutaredoxin-dependent peroxiredoxin